MLISGFQKPFLPELILGLGFGYLRGDADNEYSYRAESITLEGEVSAFPIFLNLYYYRYFNNGVNLYGGAGFSYLAGGVSSFFMGGEESRAIGNGTGVQIIGGWNTSSVSILQWGWRLCTGMQWFRR